MLNSAASTVTAILVASILWILLGWTAGRASFLADLQATRTYTDVRAQLTAANTQVAMSQIDLFLALGGGRESGRTQASNPGKP